MEIKITKGTHNTSDYVVVKNYKSLKSAQKFVSQLGYKSEIENGLRFNSAGIQYRVSIQY